MKLTAIKTALLCISAIASFVLAFLSETPAFAYTFGRTIDTTITVLSSTEVQVTQVHRLSWNNPSYFFPAAKNSEYAYIYPAFIEQTSTLGSMVKDLTVTGGGSSSKHSLAYTKSTVDGSIQLKIPYYENLEQGNDLVFTVTYKTGVYILNEGGLLEVNYPGLSSNFKQKTVRTDEDYDELINYTVTVSIPTRFGMVSSTTPTPASQQVSKEVTITKFGVNSIIGRAVHLTVGDARKVRFTLSGKTYATNGQTPEFVQNLLMNYIEVALPSSREGTEYSGQEIYYSKIDPFPVEIRTDTDGNIIAKIPISATQEGSVTIEGYAILKNVPLSGSIKSVTKDEVPVTMQNYLAGEEKYWQVTDAEIRQAAGSELVSSGNLYEQLQKTLGYVSHRLAYAEVTSEASLTRLGARKAWDQKVGVCMEYSDLLLTLLRAQGIPTRTVFGDGVGSRVDRTLRGIGHQWVSVWFPNTGWVPVDPTWSDSGQEYIGQDFNHFTWYVASKSVNEPSGFNCLSWDSQSPCRDALSIDTVPVNDIPEKSTLMTLESVKEKVLNSQKSQNKFVGTLQKGVSYLGESQLGRMLLSRQGLLIIFAFLLYSILVAVISGITKTIRKRKKVEN